MNVQHNDSFRCLFDGTLWSCCCKKRNNSKTNEDDESVEGKENNEGENKGQKDLHVVTDDNNEAEEGN
jgi:hypothetical protein